MSRAPSLFIPTEKEWKSVGGVCRHNKHMLKDTIMYSEFSWGGFPEKI